MTQPKEATLERSCKCADQVNEWLKESNGILVSNLLSPVTRATVAICKHQEGIRTKLPILEASYCPFCGRKYPGAVRRRSPGATPPRGALTKERLLALLEYKPDTGKFFWMNNRGGPAVIGKVAGEPRKDGYIVIRVDGRYWMAHRLAFLWMTGAVPSMVDHRNGNPSDNRWENLRPVTPQQNTQNRRINSNSKTGLKGVQRIPGGGFRAVITLKDKRRKVIGHFGTPEAAHEAYKAAAGAEFGEFARFA